MPVILKILLIDSLRSPFGLPAAVFLRSAPILSKPSSNAPCSFFPPFPPLWPVRRGKLIDEVSCFEPARSRRRFSLGLCTSVAFLAN